MPTLTDRQIGFKGKGAGKDASNPTDKPKGTPPVRP